MLKYSKQEQRIMKDRDMKAVDKSNKIKWVETSKITGSICAWKDCAARCKHAGELPPGWRMILVCKNDHALTTEGTMAGELGVDLSLLPPMTDRQICLTGLSRY
jgi:hypothetical protein